MSRQNIHRQLIVLIGIILACLFLGRSVQAEGSVVFKIFAVNPSETDTKEVTLRGALPPEVKPENVADSDGMEVEYDSQLGVFVVTGTVTLGPKQSITKSVLIDDVWTIPEANFKRVEQEVNDILIKLDGTTFADRGQIMADAVFRRLLELRAHQDLPFANPEAHISRYREDVKAMQVLDSELVSLRQLMVMAAIEPSKSKVLNLGTEGTGSNRGSLSVLTTWRLIFMIIGLLGIVSLSFFFIWQRQLKQQLAKQSAQEGSEEPQSGILAKESNVQQISESPGDLPTSDKPD